MKRKKNVMLASVSHASLTLLGNIEPPWSVALLAVAVQEKNCESGATFFPGGYCDFGVTGRGESYEGKNVLQGGKKVMKREPIPRNQNMF